MSNLKIRIKGEKAEALAKMLSEIEGISPAETPLYKCLGNNKIIVLLLSVGFVADTFTISQGLGKIIKEYDNWRNQGKIQAIIEKPDHSTCDFSEFLSLIPQTDSTESLSQDLSSMSLPSLQEIAKLPISERHKLLSPYMDEMAQIFNNDSELILCSLSDTEC